MKVKFALVTVTLLAVTGFARPAGAGFLSSYIGASMAADDARIRAKAIAEDEARARVEAGVAVAEHRGFCVARCGNPYCAEEPTWEGEGCARHYVGVVANCKVSRPR